jgi:hypothetical protein
MTGPSLLVHNNAIFTDVDFESIQVHILSHKSFIIHKSKFFTM